MRRAGAVVRAAARDMASARPRPRQRARDLGQVGRGRDVQLVSRPGLEELVSRHPFWRRDMAKVGLAGLLGHEVATRKNGVATWLSCSRKWPAGLMSRHQSEVATWVAAKEVATWSRDVAERGLCRLDVATSC